MTGHLPAAVAAVRARLGHRAPKVAIVLGSGLGGLADRLTDAVRVPYADIPGFHVPTVEGHRGELVAGMLAGRSVLAQSGRFHLYEGHGADVAALPARLAADQGARHALAAPARAHARLHPRAAAPGRGAGRAARPELRHGRGPGPRRSGPVDPGEPGACARACAGGRGRPGDRRPGRAMRASWPRRAATSRASARLRRRRATARPAAPRAALPAARATARRAAEPEARPAEAPGRGRSRPRAARPAARSGTARRAAAAGRAPGAAGPRGSRSRTPRAVLELLSDPEATLTVFAPTDEAFAALGEDTLSAVVADTEMLTAILSYHVVPSVVYSFQIRGLLDDMGMVDVEMADGSAATVSETEDGVFINEAQVILPDIQASNGVIHVIDAVILPPTE